MATKNLNESDFSRRSFIRKTITLGTGVVISAQSASKVLESHTSTIETELNDKSKKLMEMFHLKYPIFQAAPGGDDLAIAVSKAGAMGALALTFDSPEAVYNSVTKVKAATSGNFYANYILNFELKSLNKALEAGAPAVQFSWGIPSREIVSEVRNAGAKLGIQVTSKHNTKTALDLEPDFLICQGTEAGGHVQGSMALLKSLEEVLKIAGNTLVLAAGGIATGHDIRRVLNAGAAGAVMGTRFMATKESYAHDEYKQALTQASGDDTVLTICFNKGWPPAQHRALRNNTYAMWEAAGSPPQGERPGEKDIVAYRSDGRGIERYSSASPRSRFTGNITDLAMYAGQGVTNIKDIPSAQELIVRIWKEFKRR
jgi:nitronate monooxygenase